MRGGLRLLPALLFLALPASCRLPPEAEPAGVADLRFSPSAFDSFRANTQIRYSLKVPAVVTIMIVQRDTTGRLLYVNTLVANTLETKGTHAHTWLGDTFTGYFAPAGLYFGILQTGSERFEAAVRVFHF
ncbi:MAG: hypothetical protein WB626_08510 [Bacteroidota bacterium]